MEIDKMLKRVNNLNEYISISQKVKAMPALTKIHFNMSTVLSLKKVRALEIEYFNKCEGNGVALFLFENMVQSPPSKTWVLLGKELVSLLQYWLDAIRKHLVKHNHNWWNFLKILLKFVKYILAKDPSLPNILLEYTAECLLDLATGSEPDVEQRLEILICLNLCCGESSRDTRISLRTKLDCYLSKLAVILANCGHWPTQYSVLENLMRWLVPRHNLVLRQATAVKWVPEHVFGEKAVSVFMERAWQCFYEDAREFLNAFNDRSDLVVSVVCLEAAIGRVVLVSGTETRQFWLDINRSDKSITMVVSPLVLESLGKPMEVLESLILPDDTIQHVQINRDSSDILVTVEVSQPARLFPSKVQLEGTLKVVISFHQLQKLDNILKSLYQHRYKLLLDLSKTTGPSNQDNFIKKTTSGSMHKDARFSHPVEPQKRKQSGYVVSSRCLAGLKSPSSVSSSSLAQLHEKLAQLPRYDFQKEAVHVCALPELSTVTEVSETDDRQSITSATTVKINRPHGVCLKSIRKETGSQSDGEIHAKVQRSSRDLFPAAKIDENSTSCLLVATVGSDESVINETIERFSKSKDFHGDNIVDLIVQEALQAKIDGKDKLRDSGINTGDNRKTQEPEIDSEAIENTPIQKVEKKTKQDCEKSCTVISNTTTDESNDVVYDTPLNAVNVRKRQKELKEKVVVVNDTKNRPIFDVQEVENFFTQHLNENQRGKVVISPTLARKINETSSDSDNFEAALNADIDVNVDQVNEEKLPDNVKESRTDENIIHISEIENADIVIIECLNGMVDKVCSDLEKCTELLNNEFKTFGILEDKANDPLADLPLKDKTNMDKVSSVGKKEISKKAVPPKKAVKLKYPAKKPSKSRTNTKNKSKKLELQSVTKMSPITEVDIAADDKSEKEKTPEPTSPENNSYFNVPLLRRKRKLYTPKDENVNEKQNKKTIDEEDTDFKAKKVQTPNYKGTSYKDIEEDRKKSLRRPRSRKSRETRESTPSPRTKEMNDIFDSLRENVQSNSVTLGDKQRVQDISVYNFKSDSEDEDFKKKKIELQNKFSSTTIASGDSLISTRRGRVVNKINYSENKSSDEAKAVIPKPKRQRRKRQTKAQQIKLEKNLQDERMRKAAPEDLNTSFLVEKSATKPTQEPDLHVIERPEIEIIPDEEIDDKKVMKKAEPTKKTGALSLKKVKSKQTNYKPLPRESVDGNESPLPGLLVETIPVKKDDTNDSLSVNILQKIWNIQEGLETTNSEINTTHNLVSDIENINYSPQINISQEFDKTENEVTDNAIKNKSSKKSTQSPKPNNDELVIVLEPEPEKYKKLNTKNEHSKSKPQSCEESVKNIEISCYSEPQSEKSIATNGKSPITAHGDSDEKPPEPTHLTQGYKHRDIEIENLNQSMKDYFNNLRDQMTITINERRDSDNSSSSQVTKKTVLSVSKEQSPVVSITRLSLDDISKWLPSRRNSDTDSTYSEKANETPKYVTRKTLQKEIIIEESGTAKIQKKNKSIIEDINSITDVTTSRKSHLRKTYRKEENATFVNRQEDSESDTLKKQLKTSKIKNRSAKILEKAQEKYLDKNQNEIKTHKRNKKKRDTSSPELQKTPVKTRKTDASQPRKSIISPIRDFDDMFHTIRHESTPEEIDSLSKKQKKIKKNLAKDLETNEKRNDSRHESKNTVENIEISSVDSKISVSTICKTENKLKRKPDSPMEEYAKRRRLDKTEMILSLSDRTESSVNEWFRKMAPMERGESINATLTETVHNVMEKLDTTLSEIHQNTSKKFINMFVDAQRHLTEVQQSRRQLYKAVGKEILSDFIKILDEKFTELDKRSQEKDAEFMKDFKTKSLELIREDCKQKQLMVSLLKEDVQTVINYNRAKTNKQYY